MAAIDKISLETTLSAPLAWSAVATRVQAWAKNRGLNVRDAVVLLPFAQLLPTARAAFAPVGGWLPRIETTQTLARSLGPAALADPLQISFDVALDRLIATRLLRGQGWAQAVGNPGGFEHMVSALVQTAHALARAADAVPPAQREVHWSQGRAWLGVPGLPGGPGARERLLLRVAFEWAAASAAPASDALFALRPSAWIVVQVGGADPLAHMLLAQAADATRCLLIDTDAPINMPFDTIALQSPAQLVVCRDFEDEAQLCAGHVLARLSEGVTPVALIAQDRILVRRVRALLARHDVPLRDETGWRLSTTRAGALVASLLRAAEPRAGTDDCLDWLKACAAHWPQSVPGAGPALLTLESTLRRRGWDRVDQVDSTVLPDAAARLWHAAGRVLDALIETRSQPLGDWLTTLCRALQDCGAWAPLEADDAGRQLVTALHLGADNAVPATEPMLLAAFSQWVDAALEAASFVPSPESVEDPGPHVVITPLERAMLRPFGAVVFPGADEKRLGAPASPHPLLTDAGALALGLPGAQARRDAETLAFVQLLRHPNITLLRRVDDGGEPLAASPLLERLNLARLRAGQPALKLAAEPCRDVAVPTRAVMRPLPAAPELLPKRLSASACEALRACPYRFFALQMLRLRTADELDDAVEKRDYGTWLHEVLNRFHRGRGEATDAAEDASRLHALALEVQRDTALDDAAFLPFAASFARLVPPYLAWLQERDAAGARWLDGERLLTALPAEWHGVEMHGVIDRVDSVLSDDAAQGPIIQLIDYKTGSAAALRELVAQPLEDTQLAFYAALMARQSDAVGAIAACYLPLDAGDTVRAIDHVDVEFSAEQLIEGIGIDLTRLRAGAAMPALGEARACEYCDARGLCRRDHWPPVSIDDGSAAA